MPSVSAIRPRPRVFALVGGALLVAAVAGPVLLMPAAAATAAAQVAPTGPGERDRFASIAVPVSTDDGFVVPQGSAAASLERAERLRTAGTDPAE